jgi:hypothetical protein
MDTWTKSKWSYEQLEHKTVEFKIPGERCWIHGVGEFLIRRNPQGLLAIEISVDLPETAFSRVDRRFQIAQVGVDAIEWHDDQAGAQFRLFSTL